MDLKRKVNAKDTDFKHIRTELIMIKALSDYLIVFLKMN